jgi:hypothetical protein
MAMFINQELYIHGARVFFTIEDLTLILYGTDWSLVVWKMTNRNYILYFFLTTKNFSALMSIIILIKNIDSWVRLTY